MKEKSTLGNYDFFPVRLFCLLHDNTGNKMSQVLSCSNTVSIRDDPHWTSREDLSLEL